MKIEKWFEHLGKFGLQAVPFHGITPEGGCTCGINACKDPGDHPLSGFFLEMFTEGRLPYVNVAIEQADGIVLVEVTKAGRGAWAGMKGQHNIRKTWVCQGPRGGWVVFFKRPTDPLLHEPWDKDDGVSVRRSPVLIPPSLRPSGERVKWIVAPWECKLGSIPGSILAYTTRMGATVAPRPEHNSATRNFVRRAWWSQEGKMKEEERTAYVLDQAQRFNSESLPALSANLVRDIVIRTIAELKKIEPVPEKVNEVLSLFGPEAEVADHLSHRE